MSELTVIPVALPVDVQTTFDQILTDPTTAMELATKIADSGLAASPDLVGQLLAGLQTAADAVAFPTVPYQVFSSGKDAAGADMLLVEGDQRQQIGGQVMILADGTCLSVVSVEYDKASNLSLVRFPIDALKGLKLETINVTSA